MQFRSLPNVFQVYVYSKFTWASSSQSSIEYIQRIRYADYVVHSGKPVKSILGINNELCRTDREYENWAIKSYLTRQLSRLFFSRALFISSECLMFVPYACLLPKYFKPARITLLIGVLSSVETRSVPRVREWELNILNWLANVSEEDYRYSHPPSISFMRA